MLLWHSLENIPVPCKTPPSEPCENATDLSIKSNSFSLQREKEEALLELETAKDRLEMSQGAHNRALDEKEIANKELERLLEKYDRYVKTDQMTLISEVRG